MKRVLLQSAAFIRAAKRLVKTHPKAAPHLRDAFDALAEDAFQPALRTHKLKGKLAGSWACDVGYDLRIIFELVPHDGTEAILMQTVGTHDEVY